MTGTHIRVTGHPRRRFLFVVDTNTEAVCFDKHKQHAGNLLSIILPSSSRKYQDLSSKDSICLATPVSEHIIRSLICFCEAASLMFVTTHSFRRAIFAFVLTYSTTHKRSQVRFPQEDKNSTSYYSCKNCDGGTSTIHCEYSRRCSSRRYLHRQFQCSSN